MTETNRQAREAMHGDDYVQRFSDKRQIARVARLVEHIELPISAKVMDVGCGTGILAGLLAPRYGSYTGIDFSEAMLQQARANARAGGLQHCDFLCADAVDVMRSQPGTWDAVFMLDISEHVPDAEWAGIVDAARLALKPGGKVYLHTPNLDFVLERLKHHGLMRQFPEHVAVRDARRNLGFFERAGYSAARCTTLPHYNILRWLHPLSGLPVVGKYLTARLWIVATR